MKHLAHLTTNTNTNHETPAHHHHHHHLTHLVELFDTHRFRLVPKSESIERWLAAAAAAAVIVKINKLLATVCWCGA